MADGRIGITPDGVIAFREEGAYLDDETIRRWNAEIICQWDGRMSRVPLPTMARALDVNYEAAGWWGHSRLRLEVAEYYRKCGWDVSYASAHDVPGVEGDCLCLVCTPKSQG